MDMLPLPPGTEGGMIKGFFMLVLVLIAVILTPTAWLVLKISDLANDYLQERIDNAD